MTTRSTDFNYEDSAPGINAYKATTDTYYKGSLIAMKPSTGLAILWSDVAEYQFLGISTGQVSSTGAITDMVRVDERGVILKKVAVVGASAVTDTGSLVWASDDDANASLSLTPTVLAGAVGQITRWYSSTTCDVRLFTPAEYQARIAAAGYFTFSFLAATLADGDLVTTWTPGFAGRIVDIDAVCTAAVTTGAKASTLNLEIGTTNVTGGTVALAGTYSLGEVQAGAAITAANHFTASDTISLEASSTTTFIEGSFDVLVKYIPD